MEVKPAFKPGDVVRIMDDRAEVTKLQKGHGEWNEDMLDVSVSIVHKIITTPYSTPRPAITVCSLFCQF